MTHFLALALVVASGCEQGPAVWTPVLESASTSYLDGELTSALERVDASRRYPSSDPDRAAELLATVEVELRGLRDVYLPLFRARSRANNAYRLHYLGRHSDAAAEVEEIREIVLDVSARAENPLLGELERIEELVADAQVALEAGSPTSGSALRRLAVEMEDFVAKATLFLDVPA